jgi:hypothetical protein
MPLSIRATPSSTWPSAAVAAPSSVVPSALQIG